MTKNDNESENDNYIDSVSNEDIINNENANYSPTNNIYNRNNYSCKNIQVRGGAFHVVQSSVIKKSPDLEVPGILRR